MKRRGHALKWKSLPWQLNPRNGSWSSPPYLIQQVMKRRAMLGYLAKRGGVLLNEFPVCLARAKRLAEADAMSREDDGGIKGFIAKKRF